MRRFASLLILVALAGCGGGSEKPERLAPAERAEVAGAKAALHSYCEQIRLYLLHRRGPPTSADLARVDGSLDRLITLGREKPNASYGSEGTVRDVLGDMAEGLEATNCSASLEQKLNQAFNSSP